jgi:hypothetical protein
MGNIPNQYGHTAAQLYTDAVFLWPRDRELSPQEVPRPILDFCKDMSHSFKRKMRRETAWMEKLLN